ncbi:MAG: Fic family protein [archaeon]
MVYIMKRKVGTQNHYYLEHSLRNGPNVNKETLYLGKEIPKNIESVKEEFLSKIYKEKFFDLFDRIKQNASKEWKALPPSARTKSLLQFSTKFTYNTNRIEGSTLTLKETARLLEEGISPNKKVSDVREAESHKKVFFEMIEYKKDLSLQEVLHWHRMLLEETKEDIAGKTRGHQVAISWSKFMPPIPAEIDLLLKEFFDWYRNVKDKLHPVALAALVHLKFVTIHPFADGNGRISRLMMNFVLHKNDFPMIDIAYEKRGGYYTALERSQVRKDDSIFLQWFFKRYLKEFKKYI